MFAWNRSRQKWNYCAATLIATILSLTHASGWAGEGKPISPAQIPKKPLAKAQPLPDGGKLLEFKDGSRVWIENRTAQPLYFESGEKLPTELKPTDKTPPKPTPPPDEISTPQNTPSQPEPLKPADVESLVPLNAWNIPGQRVRALAFSADGQRLVAGLQEKKVLVYAWKSAEKVREIPNTYGASVLLLPGAKPNWLYVIEGPLLRLVDMANGNDLHTYGTNSGASANGFLSAKQDLLVLASAAGGVEFVQPDLRESLATLVPPEMPSKGSEIKSSAAAFAQKESLAASGRPNGKVYVWSLRKLEQVNVVTLAAHASRVEALEFVEGKLISLGQDGKLKLWDAGQQEARDELTVGNELRRGWLLHRGSILALVDQEEGSLLQFRSLSIEKGKLQSKELGTISLAAFSKFDSLTTGTKFHFSELTCHSDGRHIAVAIQSTDAALQQTCVGVFELPSSQLKGEKPNHVGDHAGEFRLWKTADGKFTVEAKLVTHQNKLVKLQRRDTGKIIEIGLEKLSAEDQEFARRLQK